jgi:hypothetical protein
MQLELRMNHRDSRPHEARRLPFVASLPSLREITGLVTVLALISATALIKVIPALVLHAHH